MRHLATAVAAAVGCLRMLANTIGRAEPRDHEDPIQRLRIFGAILRFASVCRAPHPPQWTFDQQVGGLDLQIEPPHCTSYEVAQLNPSSSPNSRTNEVGCVRLRALAEA